MGETTRIAWTDSTLNVWHGCQKVDTLCKHCYAEMSTPVRVKRANGLEVWGGDAARSETKTWERDLRKWDREARASGKVHRVFAQSLSDTFEDYTGGRVVRASGPPDHSLDVLRARFLRVVGECDALTLQLLTKRPYNVCGMVPASWLDAWPAHVQIGTSVGDHKSAEERIPHLRCVPAPVRFLSVEPQLEDLGSVDLAGIAWVIQGGEYHRDRSKARPFDLAWARDMRDQCRAAGVPYFLKQFGAAPMMRADSVEGRRAGDHPESEWPDGTYFGGGAEHGEEWRGRRAHLHDSHGGDEAEWPADLRGCREFPVTP